LGLTKVVNSIELLFIKLNKFKNYINNKCFKLLLLLTCTIINLNLRIQFYTNVQILNTMSC